jgi:hypothetical protein
MVVGSTTLQPGASTTVATEFTMHEGMGGPHLFEVTLRTNERTTPERKLYIASDWGN